MRNKVIIIISLFFLCILLNSSTNINMANDKPVIYRVIPDKAYTGNEIAIYGNNFGNKRENGEVFFGEFSCQDYDFDYVYWSDNLIKVKVPTGAQSDFIKLKLGKNVINGPFFISLAEDSRKYTEPLDITIEYTLDINVSNDSSKPLYLWVPSAISSDNQRNIILKETSPNLFQRQDDQLDLYKISDLLYGKNYVVRKKFTLKNYKIETNIDPEKVTSKYDVDSEFYKYYTSKEYAMECDDPRIIEVANSIVQDEENPYLKAKSIFQWVCDHMEYQYPPPNRDWRAISALKSRRGDCAVYSFLFTSLCRAAGIPARPVTGRIMFMSDTVQLHYWAEFYIPKYGWIPVDVNYGDLQVKGFPDKSFYFANMDNRHIAFSKGRTSINLPGEDGSMYHIATVSHLQKYHAYMQGRDTRYFVRRNIHRVVE